MKVVDINVELLNSFGTDLTVVNAARVSFAKESDWEYEIVEGYADYEGGGHLSDKDKGLIHFLARNKHKSPFNHAFLSFRVKAPIFIARQLVKHEYLPWNEVSRRYVTSEPEFYFPNMWRKKAGNVKQGSSDETACLSEGLERDLYLNVMDSLANYKALLEEGVCSEQARMTLPQNVMTEWIWSGSLYAFMKMCKLRMDSHSQKETREVAEKIYGIINKLFPVSSEALLEYAE